MSPALDSTIAAGVYSIINQRLSAVREQLAHLQIIVIINHANFTPFKRVLGELSIQAALAPGARGPGLCVPCFDAAEPHTSGSKPERASRECCVHHLSSSAAQLFSGSGFCRTGVCCHCFHHIHMLYFQIVMQNMDYKQIALTLNSDWMRSAQSQRSPVIVYVTLDHKTSHKGQSFEIDLYTSYENWINKLSIDVWFVMIWQYL